MSVTPDGCPVDLYLELPAAGEPEVIHGAIPAGAAVLELGCGTGRVTHPLLALGHPVVAVDESAEMLAHVVGAETVRARIDELQLDRRFPVVVLGRRCWRRHGGIWLRTGSCWSNGIRPPGSIRSPTARAGSWATCASPSKTSAATATGSPPPSRTPSATEPGNSPSPAKTSLSNQHSDKPG
ncbi:class I SAM-dependent methyltransferase [Amycolatopsis sp. La24]|uniref:class I SAM-dependent methyltransferase n=1 Tax=Amycolatopsis sp. La24 TaxID=3028304 RepID=UPI0023B0F543|nr:class I SAM-dependent methyltransferase [Amycolatopsis sp. La24]